MKSVFDFSSYKIYLRALCGQKGTRSGLKSAIAVEARCSTTYVSHVLNGAQNFSLEQAERLNRLLKHSHEESHYFLLLVHRERAGTVSLREYYDRQIQEVQQSRRNIQRRLGKDEPLSGEDLSRYYSSWMYGAIHVALSIPRLQTASDLAKKLQIAEAKVRQILEFLTITGLARNNNGRFTIGPTHIHLGNKSVSIGKHHTNWRMRAIDSLNYETTQDLHYSAAVTLSQQDVEKIRDYLLGVIQAAADTIEKSKEEKIYCLAMDFFNLERI